MDVERLVRRDPWATGASFAAFHPPPPALCPVVASAPAPAGSAQAHAEVAALAERMVTTLRVGRVGKGGHEVRMRLRVGPQSGLEVQLRYEGDELTAVLRAEPHTRGEAERIASRLQAELEERGVAVAQVSVELD